MKKRCLLLGMMTTACGSLTCVFQSFEDEPALLAGDARRMIHAMATSIVLEETLEQSGVAVGVRASDSPAADPMQA